VPGDAAAEKMAWLGEEKDDQAMRHGEQGRGSTGENLSDLRGVKVANLLKLIGK
jgi:hypothetical protein